MLILRLDGSIRGILKLMGVAQRSEGVLHSTWVEKMRTKMRDFIRAYYLDVILLASITILPYVALGIRDTHQLFADVIVYCAVGIALLSLGIKLARMRTENKRLKQKQGLDFSTVTRIIIQFGLCVCLFLLFIYAFLGIGEKLLLFVR